jgi:hypothetical protein
MDYNPSVPSESMRKAIDAPWSFEDSMDKSSMEEASPSSPIKMPTDTADK